MYIERVISLYNPSSYSHEKIPHGHCEASADWNSQMERVSSKVIVISVPNSLFAFL